MKDKDGKVIDCNETNLKRWKEYFREVLNLEAPSISLEEITVEFEELEIDLSTPTKNEVKQEVGKLKNNKSMITRI